MSTASCEIDQTWEVVKDFPTGWELSVGDTLFIAGTHSYPNDPPELGNVMTCINPNGVKYIREYLLKKYCILRIA